MHACRRPLARLPALRRALHSPNAPLELDPSFQQLLRDTDLSLLRARKHKPRVIHELEVTGAAVEGSGAEEAVETEDGTEGREERRSAAAVFGTKRVGAVVLPFELERSILSMIEDSDKNLLHRDAKRLFLSPSPKQSPSSSSSKWSNTPHSRIHKRGRDGLAYVAVGMPGQYAAVENVLREVRGRIGQEWMPETVLDCSYGAGGALWAALKVFRGVDAPEEEVSLPHSTLKQYVGINPNAGMVSLARRLLSDVDIGKCKFSFQDELQEDTLPIDSLPKTIAISAFVLSELSNDNARRQMAKDLWQSGAEVIVIIDNGTKAGFNHVADARRRILRLGQREALDAAGVEESEFPAELEEITVAGRTFIEQRPKRALDTVLGACHVVAPCPHDGQCPLHNTSDFCHFSQRLQRPSFVRQTKHSPVGEEDTPYSYVVIKRGPRPSLSHDSPRRGSGRVGAAGREEAARKEEKERKERKMVFELGEEVVLGLGRDEEREAEREVDEGAMRVEAYEWPRIVYPPMKRSGHVIMDMCTSSGQIERHTIPKSQGKQPYYDARKATWGDVFPHPPKVPPVVRTRGVRRLTKPQPAPAGTEPEPSTESILENVLGGAFEEAQNRTEKRLF